MAIVPRPTNCGGEFRNGPRLLFWVWFLELAAESLGAKRTKRKATNGWAGRSHALPPIVRASWESRLQASYSHQMGGKEESSTERESERERSKGPRPETPRMMNEDFVSKNASINLWNLVILSSPCESF
jgi:hypothetical protein